MSTDVEARAATVAEATRADVVALLGARGAVVLQAVAGAGKSTFIVETVGMLAAEGVTLAVGAPTNEQVFGLVGALARRHPQLTITYAPARSVTLPSEHLRPNVQVASPTSQARGAQIVVGTLDKLGDAYHRGDVDGVDCLIVDEAYQADSARYYQVADIADVHLLVGDSGQIDPFSTTTEAERYRGLDEDPIRTAVEVITRTDPATRVHRFPITRRLDERALPAARCFYPADHRFDAAVGAGTRELRLLDGLARDARTRQLDAALDLARDAGLAHVELPAAAVGVADPQIARTIVDLLVRLRERDPRVRCERVEHGAVLGLGRVAVGVSHNEQARVLRRGLADRGLDDVVVATANKLQGLEYDITVCWHPLAGLTQTDAFHLEAGRLCVLATRHRHACIVVGRSSDRTSLEAVPPSPPAWLGREDDPLLDGWDVHRRLFAALDPTRISVAA